MKKKPLIVGNWKMNKTVDETVDFIKKLAGEITNCNAEVYLAVPFTSITEAKKASEKTKIIIGAQNMNDASKGAFTGEISAVMLLDAGAEFVILGHSERRMFFGETDDFINKKLIRAVQDDIAPILCIGESLEQRENGKMKEVLKNQLTQALKKVSKEDIKDIKIAYEPIWAIGTGKTATAKQAEEVHKFIRTILQDLFGKKNAADIYILYGGSVKENNIKSLLKEKNIDGVLVGKASLEVDSFENMIKNF